MAAVWARVDRIVYGAADSKAGAAWSLYNIPQDERLNHRCELVAGVLAGECAAVLEEFFDRAGVSAGRRDVQSRDRPIESPDTDKASRIWNLESESGAPWRGGRADEGGSLENC